MKKHALIIPVFLLLIAICNAETAGDLNNDGKLDIADYVRLNAMVVKSIQPETQADLDGDGNVTNADADILMGLIRGTYFLPAKLDYKISIEKEPDENHPGTFTDQRCISGKGFRITWSTYSPYNVSLWTVDGELPNSPLTDVFHCKLSTPIGINNLPYNYDMKFTLDVPKENSGTPALLLGSLLSVKGNKSPDWFYQIIEVDGETLTYKDNQLIWKPSPCLSSKEISNSAPILLTVIAPTNEGTRSSETRGSSTQDDLGIDFEANRFDFGPDIFTTKHFQILAYDRFSLSGIQKFALSLEKAYRIIGSLGFKQTVSIAWSRRVKVSIRRATPKQEPGNAYTVSPGLLTAPQLEFNSGVFGTDNMGSIAIHELMHYHHYIYATNFTCIWLDEMCTTWSERLMSDDPENYHPLTYGIPRASLDCIPFKSEKPWPIIESAINKAASTHGYDLYPFAVWLTKKYPAEELWHRIFSSRGYELGEALTALQTGIRQLDREADLGELYDAFVREFFIPENGLPYPSNSYTPLLFFDQIDPAKFAENGHKTIINNQADLFLKENTTHKFMMSQLGTATWLYTFAKGTDEFLKEYNEVIIKASGTQYDFFVIRPIKGKFTLTSPNDIIRDEDNNVSFIRIPLEGFGSIDKKTFFGIVAVNHNYDTYNEETKQEITLSVSLSGPITIKNIISNTPYDEIINDSYRWIHDYTKVESNLTFTPQGKTTFADSYVYVCKDVHNGVNREFPVITTHLTGADIPDKLEFNITGTMTDIPVPRFVNNSSSLFFDWILGNYTMWSECTERYVVTASKSFDKTFNPYAEAPYFYTEGAVGQYNTIVGGLFYTAEDFAPSGSQGLSRFNIVIPEIDKKATSYKIQIETHYLRYTQQQNSDQVTNEGSFHNLTLQFEIFLK